MNVEELLRDSLREEAARTEHEPTPLEQVAWRARSLRRNRRARVAGVSLVAAAAAVPPVALTVPGMIAADPHRQTGSRLFAAMPDSGAPTVDWLDGELLHRAGGTEQQVPFEDVRSFLPFRQGVLATTYADAPAGLARIVTLGADGSVTREECGSPLLALDGDVATRAVSYDCRRGWDQGVEVSWQDVTGPQPSDDVIVTPNGFSVDPVGKRGDFLFYNSTPVDGGGSEVVRSHLLGPPDQLEGLATAADVSRDGRWLLAVTGAGRDVVADAVTGAVRNGLSARAVAFSPDDRHVAAVTADGRLTVLDARTGEPVVGPVDDAGELFADVPGRIAWESPTRLLAVTTEAGEEAVVRVDLDGTVTRATGPRPRGSLVLVTQP